MKKLHIPIILAAILTLMMTAAAFAQTGEGNPRGEVLSVDETGGTLTILTSDDSEVVITLPEDFDYSSISVGMTVLAKGTWTETGLDAEWVKEAGPGDKGPNNGPAAGAHEDEGEGDGWGQGGKYCNDESADPHPMAAKLADDYGVETDWVMDRVCDGHGFGAIMLALKTAELEGGNAEDYLAERKGGRGWGEIWKELGIIGNARAGSPPPGLLNRENKGNNGNGHQNQGNPGGDDDEEEEDENSLNQGRTSNRSTANANRNPEKSVSNAADDEVG